MLAREGNEIWIRDVWLDPDKDLGLLIDARRRDPKTNKSESKGLIN